jgi:hypothetical protein
MRIALTLEARRTGESRFSAQLCSKRENDVYNMDFCSTRQAINAVTSREVMHYGGKITQKKVMEESKFALIFNFISEFCEIGRNSYSRTYYM